MLVKKPEKPELYAMKVKKPNTETIDISNIQPAPNDQAESDGKNAVEK